MKKIFLGMIILLSLSSCNTIRGVGEDVEGVGRSLQRNADY